MHPAFLPLSRRCLYALKPASWPKLLVPAALGQVLGVLAADQWSWGGAAVGLGFTLAALAYIVLLNDWFDVRVDAIKRQMFPDAGSPKTIPDAILHPQTVLLAGIGAGLCAAATGLCGELMVGRVGLGLAGVALLGLLLVYSAPPLRWNERGLGEVVEAVNFNDPAQTVIAGSKAAVEKACEALKAAGAKRALPLPVSAPFHSSLMKPAAEKLRAALAAIPLAAPQIPVLNNIDVAVQQDADAIRDALYRQAFGPVRWVECVQALKARGITHIVECGPGKVLAGMTKRIDAELTGAALYDPATLNEVKELLA